MTTNRTPIQRPALTMITPRALDLYVAMGKLKCSCPSPKPPTQSPCSGCTGHQRIALRSVVTPAGNQPDAQTGSRRAMSR